MNDALAAANEKNLLAVMTASLAKHGLTPVEGQLAFAHKGETVTVSIEQSVYTGYYIIVHDRRRPARQFRAHAGNYDWNSIAHLIIEIAESRLEKRLPVTTPAGVRANNRPLADKLAELTGAGPLSPMTIEPSSSAPGRVRVRVEELDLDPDSVMQLYAVVSRARSKKPTPPQG